MGSLMTLPVLLSLSPQNVIEGVYERLKSDLVPHELRFASRAQQELQDSIAQADYVLGDWTAELKLDRSAIEAARAARVIVHPTAGYDSIDVGAARDKIGRAS